MRVETYLSENCSFSLCELKSTQVIIHCSSLIIITHRLYVRIFDGNEHSKEGWIPASILDIKQANNAIYGDRADDAAYRREYVFLI